VHKVGLSLVDRFSGTRRAFALLVLAGFSTLTAPAWGVPSFARQTGMTCSACHTVFPELTPFGREFKLNGYVFDNMRQIKGETMERRETLSLNAVAPLSIMAQISYSHTGAPLPDSAVNGALAKDGDLLFPQQISFFYAGKIANDLGAYVQLTYDGAADAFSMDNTDIRYARYLGVAEPDAGSSQTAQPRNFLQQHDVLVGLTLNNNPTVQDAWNTTQAWGFPYASSSVVPGPSASTKLDSGGGLAQTVAGLGGYLWFDHSFYAEISAYTEANIGGAHPVDSTQSEVLNGLSPYWRLGYEYRWDRNSLFVGTYGLQASVYPGNGNPLHGPTDKFTDFAVDAQYQFIGDDHLFTGMATYIHEDQHLDASFPTMSANLRDNLHTIKASFEYYYRRTIGGTVAFFSTSGSADALLYPNDGSVNGSLNAVPDSRGEILELDYLPFLNTKLAVQYTAYSKFDGGSSNYNGAGRSASDNDTLYVLLWVAF
jgi:hypothetical protein